MISAFFIFNSKGEVLASRYFRSSVLRNLTEVFRIQVIANREVRTPVLTLGSTSFLYIRCNDIWLVAATRSNQDAAVIFEFLYKFKELLELTICNFRPSSSAGNGGGSSNSSAGESSGRSSSGKSKTVDSLSSPSINDMAKNVNNYINAVQYSDNGLSENEIMDNFSVVYELIDQVLVFGYPQNLELGVLKPYISQRLRSSSFSNSSGSTNSINGSISNSSSPNLSNLVSPSSSGSRFVANVFRSPTMAISRSFSSSSDTMPTNNSIFGSNSGLKMNNSSSSLVSWRRHDVKYRKNEVFLNINEKVNVLMNANGKILKSYVEGVISMNAKLSGTPTCFFTLNDSSWLSKKEGADFLRDYDVKNSKSIPSAASSTVKLEDFKFHQCVNLNEFEKSKVIKFIPPDGQFELLKYHTVEDIKLPFLVSPVVQKSDNSIVKFNVSIKSLFPARLIATNVVIKIPVPSGSMNVKSEVTSGKSKYLTEDSLIVWRINKFNGDSEATLQAVVKYVVGSLTTTQAADQLLLSSPTSPVINSMFGNSLTSVISNISTDRDPQDSKNVMDSSSPGTPILMSPTSITQNWTKQSILVNFILEAFSCSGLVVRSLKIKENSGYNTTKWVKYSLTAGTYEIRY